MLRVLVMPTFPGPDNGDGGIRRIVEAQKKYLPLHGIEVVQDETLPYDMVAVHAGDWPRKGISPNVPVSAHCHGLYWSEFQWPAGAMAVNNAVVHNLLRADSVSVCSEFVGRAIRKALWIDPTVIYHGVEPAEWDRVYTALVKADDARASMAARYVLWNKARIDPICDPTPVARLATLLPDVRFVTTFLPATVRPSDYRNVVVTGRVDYKRSQIMTKSADVYLGTTRGTFDISVIEAMICGVPVLGWNWGSLSEAVIHKEHGYLANPGDYTDLVNGYYYIQEHRVAMSEACRRQAMTRFTWAHIMEQYAQMYKDTYAATLDMVASHVG